MSFLSPSRQNHTFWFKQMSIFLMLVLAIGGCGSDSSGSGKPSDQSNESGAGNGAAASGLSQPQTYNFDIDSPEAAPPDLPAQIAVSAPMGGGVPCFERCTDLSNLQTGPREYPIGYRNAEWCALNLTEPLGSTLTATLRSPDGSVQTLEAEVFDEDYSCVDFEYQFKPQSPAGEYVFEVDLSGRHIVDSFLRQTPVMPLGVYHSPGMGGAVENYPDSVWYGGFSPGENVRLVWYSYEGGFVAERRVQADQQGTFMVTAEGSTYGLPSEAIGGVSGRATGDADNRNRFISQCPPLEQSTLLHMGFEVKNTIEVVSTFEPYSVTSISQGGFVIVDDMRCYEMTWWWHLSNQVGPGSGWIRNDQVEGNLEFMP